MWFVSWDAILKHVFSLYLSTESYFHFWAHIIFIAACTIFVFMKYFTTFCELLLNRLINLTSVSITLSAECFSAIFKNITHALYKQKRPCKVGWNVYMGKIVPPKRDPGFLNVGSLVGGIIHLHIADFDFSIELFYKVRSRLTEPLTLPGCCFSK